MLDPVILADITTSRCWRHLFTYAYKLLQKSVYTHASLKLNYLEAWSLEGDGFETSYIVRTYYSNSTTRTSKLMHTCTGSSPRTVISD